MTESPNPMACTELVIVIEAAGSRFSPEDVLGTPFVGLAP